MKQLVIIGAGGHGRVAADIARQTGYEAVVFLDDGRCDGVAGPVSNFETYKATSDFFVAIGDAHTRERIMEQLTEHGGEVVTLIHPRATVADSVTVGKGSLVAAGAVINPCAVIGDGVIVNTCASVDHDCVCENFSHISVGAHLCGTVTVGKYTWIGAGATVIQGLTICEACMIGAGAVVVKDITKSGTYVGVPARENK